MALFRVCLWLFRVGCAQALSWDQNSTRRERERHSADTTRKRNTCMGMNVIRWRAKSVLPNLPPGSGGVLCQSSEAQIGRIFPKNLQRSRSKESEPKVVSPESAKRSRFAACLTSFFYTCGAPELVRHGRECTRGHLLSNAFKLCSAEPPAT